MINPLIMDDEMPGEDPNKPELSPKELTERLNNAQEGEKLLLNNRNEIVKVTESDRYSLSVADNHGNEFSISQNLQTGGWSIHEEVFWVQLVSNDK